ncbi:MAG: formate C-acetyltransferase [Chloroflexi bacterium]|nr:formate C-acetyltransferase [Chloroflexota bacterium]
MQARIAKLTHALQAARANGIPVSTVKGQLITEAFQDTEGQPQIIRNALAIAKVLDNIPIFIEDDDMLAGNLASKPGGVELTCLWGTWSPTDLDSLIQDGFSISADERAEIARMNEYWRRRTLTGRMVQLYDNERLWPYAQLGVVLPAFRSKDEGWGPGGMIGCGYGVRHEISQILGIFDFEKVLNQGTRQIIEEAQQELRSTRILSADAVKKVDYLKAVILAHQALIRFAGRFAVLAKEMAAKEQNPERRAELEKMAVTCRWVPANPARTFYEAMQSFWLTLLVLLPSGVLSLGRFDQFMYPFYKRDRAVRRITDDQVLEVLEWLRFKDSQIIVTAGSTHRNKYGGHAKWHNMTIGGQTGDGRDATNELTFLVLEAARDCPTPHHTITLRVHDGMPAELMRKALELVRTGIGMPAFIADQSCIDYLLSHGIPLRDARNYAIAGCLAINVPTQSRTIAHPMFVVPMVFEYALNNGRDPRTGKQVGPETGEFESFDCFEDWMKALQSQLAHFIELQAEFNNITIRAYGELYPQPIESSLMIDGIRAGRDILERTLPLENGSVLNPIGMINVADSMAAIKKLVFEEKKISPRELMVALAANWAGERNQEIHRLCLAAPKYGNDDDYVDDIAHDLYQFWAAKTMTLGTSLGGKQKPASITIGTCQIPGGAATGATPDGRYAGESLADESMAAMRGRDVCGPRAQIKSAAKIDQVLYQSTSLDLKFHPAALANEEGLQKLGDLILTYFRAGGKHIQFNVASNPTLLDAQEHPEQHKNLIVRIGGCSAYFVELTKPVQDEIIKRTEHQHVS